MIKLIIEKIKEARLAAMKSKDAEKTSFLTILYSEVAMFGKNNGNRETTDEEAIKVLKKFVKGAEETIEIGEKNGRDVSKSKLELEILAEYLPKQLSEQDLKLIVDSFVAKLPDNEKNKKSMGKVMSYLKTNYGGQYDGKMASDIVKVVL